MFFHGLEGFGTKDCLICFEDDSVESHNLRQYTYTNDVSSFPFLSKLRRHALPHMELFKTIFHVEDISCPCQVFVAHDGHILSTHQGFISLVDLENVAQKSAELELLRVFVGKIVLSENKCIYSADSWAEKTTRRSVRDPEKIDILCSEKIRVRLKLLDGSVVESSHHPHTSRLQDIADCDIAQSYPFRVFHESEYCKTLGQLEMKGSTLLLVVPPIRPKELVTVYSWKEYAILQIAALWAWILSLFASRHNTKFSSMYSPDRPGQPPPNEYFGGDSTVYQGRPD